MFGSIRTVELNNDVWFVGKDVAVILGYTNPQKAIRDHVTDDDKTVNVSFTVNGTSPLLINESGLYSLILSSKLEKAKEFKHWVTSEVLPSIRKHGLYAVDEILANPDSFIQVLQELKAERAKSKKLEKNNKELTLSNNHLTQRNNLLTHSKKTYTASEIAKELGFKSAIEFNKDLERKDIQYKRNGTWLPTSYYADKGYYDIKQEVLENGMVVYNSHFTQKGREFILNIYKKELELF